MIALLKSDRFGMEIFCKRPQNCPIQSVRLKSDRFGMEIRQQSCLKKLQRWLKSDRFGMEMI